MTRRNPLTDVSLTPYIDPTQPVPQASFPQIQLAGPEPDNNAQQLGASAGGLGRTMWDRRRRASPVMYDSPIPGRAGSDVA